MTRPGEQAAVEAARYADYMQGGLTAAEAVVAAAYPVIAAAVREQIATEIEANQIPGRYAVGDETYNEGMRAAARVARGTPDGQG